MIEAVVPLEEEPVEELAVVSEAQIPPPPFVFEPWVMGASEWDPFFSDPFLDTAADDEDFWADFFVVGEDSMIAYDDGFYFLNLFINDEFSGDIEVEFLGESRRLNTDELSYYLAPHITDSAYARIFGDEQEYLSIEEIASRGVVSHYDAEGFAVYLTFSIEDMPERMVSISSSSISRRQQYAMSGAIELKPARFAIASSISLYAMAEYPVDFSQLNSSMLSLSVSNRVSLFGVGLNFYYSITPLIGSKTSGKVLNFGSWNGFYDFVDSSHRLSFGNVGTSLHSMKGGSGDVIRDIGITFEKNYSYGTSSAKGSQFEHRIVVTEPSDVEILINGEQVFSRTFMPGTYRLRDFVLTQGANNILIRTTGRDSGEVHSEYVDMGYDYRLLGKGDTLYGVSLSMPQVKSDTRGRIFIPWFEGQFLNFHPEHFTASYFQQIGLTDTFTFSSDLAYSPGVFSSTFSGVLATIFGTSQLQLTVGLNEGKNNPSLVASYGHRFSGKRDSKFGSLSMSLSHTIPSVGPGDTLVSQSGLSLSYTGSLTERIRYTVSTNLNYNSADSSPSWSSTLSSGFSPFKGFSISGSITATGAAASPLKPIFAAQISGSYTFSQKASVHSSTSLRYVDGQAGKTVLASTSAGVNWRPNNNNSVNFSLNGFQWKTDNPVSIAGYWSHTGEMASFSVRQQYSQVSKTMNTTLTANTSIAYAGGALAISRSVSDSFLLIKPRGELRRSEVSAARSLDSAPAYLKRPLGSALYNGLGINAKNSIAVFASGATEYSAGHAFVFEASPRSRQSFVAYLDVEPSYTVSGLLYEEDGSPYMQYSSPVYQVFEDEHGDREFVRDDSLYLFTDFDGRFILNDVVGGTYIFDLKVDDAWYAVAFTVPVVPSGAKVGLERVLLLEDFWVADPLFEDRIEFHEYLFEITDLEEVDEFDVFGAEISEGYDAEVVLEIAERVGEEEFWTLIFPPFDEDDFSFEDFDDFFTFEEFDDFFEFDDADAYEPFFFDELLEQAGEYEGTEVVTAAP
ncbi:MAG TPA: hypothetical protein VFC80_01420 [Sphaerochaeta sp.]|nr:hypothetical protein [Sphaerochaeta sp.]